MPEVKGEAIALASDYFTSLSADGAANYRMKTDGTNCKAFTTQSFRQTPVRKRGMSQEVKSSGDEQDGPVDAK